MKIQVPMLDFTFCFEVLGLTHAVPERAGIDRRNNDIVNLSNRPNFTMFGL